MNKIIIHPGEILLEEFIKPLEISQYRLAKDICVPARRINEIVHGMRGITADTALRLGQYFGTSANFWINLQTKFDLETQKQLSFDTIKVSIKTLEHPLLKREIPTYA